MDVKYDKISPNRKTAKTRGEKVYFTRRKCPNGHLAGRYTSNAACIICLGVKDYDNVNWEKLEIKSKICVKCGSEFIGARCAKCRRLLGKNYRKKNREYYNRKQRDYGAKSRKYVRHYKEINPCVDCGKYDYWYTMEFDHLEGRIDEYATVGSLTSSGRIKRIQEEMKKCDLLCVRCHKIRTHKRAVKDGQRINS